MDRGTKKVMDLASKIDSELLRQMEQTAALGMPVEAVVRLRSEDPQRVSIPAARTEQLTSQLLQRVAEKVGLTAHKVNIFRNLGSFAIAAEPSFLRELITQPEVASAIANRQSGSALIPPVVKRPADLEEVGEEKGRSSTNSGKATASKQSQNRSK